jgi:branched-subunit amino acid aminotransferase/4-amino-4-deoxychorismate lyase
MVWIVSNPPIPRIEVNGRAATAEQLGFPALVNYGHFTAMQVRSGRVRGLDLHRTRLDAATQELFGAKLDGNQIRDHIRHALGDDARDASVYVTVFWPDADDQASIMVTVRAPADMPSTPQSLQTVPYQRPVPHIKHVGSFAQIYYGRLAERNGFDDALLTGPGGVISEGAIANIGFFDGATVVWPEAPALQGITRQLLEPRPVDSGLPSRRSEVRLTDLFLRRGLPHQLPWNRPGRTGR